MKTVILTTGLLGLLISAQQARAHCEIPCGIYGDELRFELLAEHISTIEKSMNEIKALAKAKRGAGEENQLARWVANKEAHAEKLQTIVSQYFLHQRIKPAPAKDAKAHGQYLEQLQSAHQLLLGAMKAKQTVDLKVVNQLRGDLERFRSAYFGPGHKDHGRK